MHGEPEGYACAIYVRLHPFTRPDNIISMPNAKKNNKGKSGKRSIPGQAAWPKVRGNLPLVSQTPQSRRVLLSYSTSISLVESAAGSGATYFYRLNSPYDPDASGVGAVAIGYSTYAALFLNYKVHRVTVRLQGTTNPSTGGAARVTIAPVAYQAVVPANKQTWSLIPGSVTKLLSPNANGGPSVANLVASYDNAAVARVTKQQYAVDMDWSGQIGSNPARQNYLMVAVDSVGSSTVATLNYNIQITYEVEWFNPVPLS